MTDEEFERLYGRPPVKAGAHRRVKVRWGRIIIALMIFVLIICGIVQLFRSIFGSKDTKPAVVTSSADSSESSSVDSTADDTSKMTESKPAETKTESWEFKVCIDPGHGGVDDGACLIDEEGNVLRKEKEDTFKLSMAIKSYLLQQGVQVVMTRETDEMLDLADICKIANDNRCDLFVSIHRDSMTTDISGFEACVHSKKPEMDTVLASNIMTNLQAVGISNNRGLVYGYTNDPTQNYHVNADTVCPSVLMEMGFITSAEDNKLIDDHLNDYAKAIGDAIIKTAQDLKVVDANGTRLLNKQLISETKLYYPLEYYYSNGNANVAG